MKIIYPWIWLLLACVSTAFSSRFLTGKISLDSINFEGQANFLYHLHGRWEAVWRNGKDAQSTISFR